MALAALVMAMEGVLVLAYGRAVTIEGLTTLSSFTVMVGGLGLLVFSLVALVFIANDAIYVDKGPLPRGLMDLFIGLGGIIIMVMGLFVTTNADNVSIEGLEGVRQPLVALFGSQLFCLGLISSMIWLTNGSFAFRNWVYCSIGTVIALVLLLQGMTILSSAAASTIGGFTAKTMFLGGTQLTLLAFLVLIGWMPLLKSIKSGRRPWYSYLMYLICALVAVEGLVVVFYASPISIDGFGWVRKSYVSLWGSLLAVSGVASMVAWFMRDRIVSRDLIIEVAGLAVALVLLMEGLMLYGLRGDMIVGSIGGILSGTMGLAIIALVIVSLFPISAWTHMHRPLMIRGRQLVPDRYVLMAGAVASMAFMAMGMAIMRYASPTHIEGWGTFTTDMVLFGGAQLFYLGLAGALLWTFRGLRPCCEIKRVGVALVAYILLLTLALFLL